MSKFDLVALEGAGLVTHDSDAYEPTERGRRLVESQRMSGSATERVERDISSFFESEPFDAAFARAYERWAQAERLLRADDVLQHLTTIGHLCREAVQEFADAALRIAGIADKGNLASSANTKARLQAVLQQVQAVGTTTRAFLDALHAYWCNVDELAQRQEHGAQREGEPLHIEDGRRLVFQTLIVMFEIAQVLQPRTSIT